MRIIVDNNYHVYYIDKKKSVERKLTLLNEASLFILVKLIVSSFDSKIIYRDYERG